ncbi:MAG: RNA-binding S4 domain-containing protein [Streptococcaceae bacterium]|nr:RNA-binding S4 domain-containing protein [Streptococcaceae bacterium]
MEEYILFKEFITLGQFLKEVGEISTGGQAKHYLFETPVWVNNEQDNRRGRKIRDGFIIRLANDQEYAVRNANEEEVEEWTKEREEFERLQKLVEAMNKKTQKKPKKTKVQRKRKPSSEKRKQSTQNNSQKSAPKVPRFPGR